MRKLIKQARIGANVRTADLSAPVRRAPTAMVQGNSQRSLIYQSPRWRRARAAFLKLNPVCITAGCGARATIVDHREGHRHPDWRLRFWDAQLWQPMCLSCHGLKSRAELADWRQHGEGLGFKDGTGGQKRAGKPANSRRAASR